MAGDDVKRILLALDACCAPSSALADAIATLAVRLDAELEGLFVEDVELLRAAALPFVREVSGAGRERSITPDAVRAHSRDVSQALERLLGSAAEARRVRWRFRTAEGARIATAFSASQNCDLFVPARLARRNSGADPARGMLRRVGVIAVGPAEIERALPVVHALARNGHTQEVVLVGPGRPAEEMLAVLARERLRTYVQAASLSDPAGLMAAFREHAPGLLIAPRSLMDPPVAAHTFESLPMSLLLLR